MNLACKAVLKAITQIELAAATADDYDPATQFRKDTIATLLSATIFSDCRRTLSEEAAIST